MKVRRSESARIRTRYAHLLADVVEPARPAEVVDVASIEELARLAERCGATIGTATDGGGRDQFTVDDGGVRYRYRTRATARLVRATV